MQIELISKKWAIVVFCIFSLVLLLFLNLEVKGSKIYSVIAKDVFGLDLNRYYYSTYSLKNKANGELIESLRWEIFDPITTTNYDRESLEISRLTKNYSMSKKIEFNSLRKNVPFYLAWSTDDKTINWKIVELSPNENKEIFLNEL